MQFDSWLQRSHRRPSTSGPCLLGARAVVRVGCNRAPHKGTSTSLLRCPTLLLLVLRRLARENISPLSCAGRVCHRGSCAFRGHKCCQGEDVSVLPTSTRVRIFSIDSVIGSFPSVCSLRKIFHCPHARKCRCEPCGFGSACGYL